jgi:hypothetical protein
MLVGKLHAKMSVLKTQGIEAIQISSVNFMEEGKCRANVLASEYCNVSTGNRDREGNVHSERM